MTTTRDPNALLITVAGTIHHTHCDLDTLDDIYVHVHERGAEVAEVDPVMPFARLYPRITCWVGRTSFYEQPVNEVASHMVSELIGGDVKIYGPGLFLGHMEAGDREIVGLDKDGRGLLAGHARDILSEDDTPMRMGLQIAEFHVSQATEVTE